MAIHHDHMKPQDLERHLDGRKLDFRSDANINQDFQGIAQVFADRVVAAWGSRARSEGFHSDAQLGQAALCSLTAMQRGFYLMPALAAQFADGTLVTLTDRGVHPGDERIETETMGARYLSKDDGITAPDQLPERSVTMGEDMYEQRYHPVRDKAEITMQMIAKGDKRGYDTFEQMGILLRREHDQNLNNLIRRGNANAKLTGMTNHPGLRHYSASVDWGSALATDIWDDYRAAMDILFTSATQDGIPEIGLLPTLQYSHIKGEQFSDATDTTLKTWIENNTEGHRVMYDYGMSDVDSNGNPGALFYTNREDLLRVTMPYWLRMGMPFQVNELVMRIMIESRYAGVQVTDVNKMLLVEGSAAGWAKPAA